LLAEQVRCHRLHLAPGHRLDLLDRLRRLDRQADTLDRLDRVEQLERRLLALHRAQIGLIKRF
jgi:hypothetical protein